MDRTAFLQVHGGRRNGYYPRKLETTFGQVDLKVPRDRESRYYPAFLKPYARRLVDVGEVAVALYAAGVSQLKTCTSRIPRINLHSLPRAAPDPGRGAPAG
ncbi:hypothetical protein TthAA22_23970 (plasmid) [Thermus thermophilus]|nr:hypothetical protein TthAA22_23970 [Thermus thermophilus]